MIDATAAIPNSIMMNAATKGSLDLSVTSMLCRSIPYGKEIMTAHVHLHRVGVFGWPQ